MTTLVTFPTSEVVPESYTEVLDTDALEAQFLEAIEPLPLDRNPAAVYLASLGDGSQRTMHDALEVTARMISGNRHGIDTFRWGQMRFQHVAALKSRLTEQYAPATVNKYLAAIKGVALACWNLGQIDTDTLTRIKAIKSVKGSTLPAGRALKQSELQRLFEACDRDNLINPAIAARDKAVLGVLYSVGAPRRSEAAAFDMSDYNPSERSLKIRQGKGHKDRMTYLSAQGAAALNAWLWYRGTSDGPLFLPVNKGGNIQAQRLSPDAVLQIIKKRAEQAGVQHCSPHDMRRSCITDLLDRGANIAVVSKAVGHASVTTTLRYDRSEENAKRNLADKLTF